MGCSGAFCFDTYSQVSKSHAIAGNELVAQTDLVMAVSKVQPTLLFKYEDLKEVMTNVLKQF